MKKRITLTAALTFLAAAPAMAAAQDLQVPPAPAEFARFGPNDSLASFSRDQGVSLSELRALNPGRDLARLNAGSWVRVFKVSPRALLAIRGGDLNAAPGAGPDTIEKQRIRNQIESNKNNALLVAARRADARRRRFKQFGDCRYDWQAWGQSRSGVRSAATQCGGVNFAVKEVAVDCNKLLVSSMKYRQWHGWKNPQGGQVSMVAELCANTSTSPRPVYLQPKTAPNTLKVEHTTPACTGPALLCSMD